MRSTLAAALAVTMAFAAVSPAAAQTATGNAAAASDFEERQTQALIKAFRLSNDGKPGEALSIFTEVIAAYEKGVKSNVIYRCAGSSEQALGGLLEAITTNPDKDAVAVSRNWCAALFGKGFVLIDLGRPAEARDYLAKAVEMEPDNAHYINEYAEWYKGDRQWNRSYDLFTRAWDIVSHDKNGPDRRMAARSLRGMAFNLIELGDLDKAEKLLNQSLDYEPEAKAKVENELAYIASMRKRR